MKPYELSAIEFGKELISTLDRQEVLRRLLDRLIKEFDVERGSVWSVERDKVVPIFSLNKKGGQDKISEELNRIHLNLGEGFVGLAAKTGKPNLSNAPYESPKFSGTADTKTGHSTKRIISIPLNQANKTIGVIQLLDRNAPFTDVDQNRLMEHYAPWATIALDNANLYKETSDLIEFGKELLSHRDRRDVLRKLLDRLIKEFDVERGSVWSVERDKVIPIFSLTKKGVEDEISSIKLSLGEGFVGLAAKTGKPNLSNAPYQSPKFSGTADTTTGHSTQRIISIPLNQANKTIGVIQLLDRNFPFTNVDQNRLMEHYAPWATIALDNANLYIELDEMAEGMVHDMGNVIGTARNKIYFLDKDLNKFINSVENSVKEFSEAVFGNLQPVETALVQSNKLIKAHSRAYRVGTKELVNVTNLVNLAQTQLAHTKKITVTNEVPENLPEILIEKETLIFHFLELMTNAIKAMEDSGKVEKGIVKVTGKLNKANSIELRFVNSGPKIPDTDKEIIFGKYLKSRDLTADRSSGLGLWAARKFFERQGGSIELEENTEDGFTTFLVTLPCNQ